MPKITQVPTITTGTAQTYFLVVDNKLAKRFNYQQLVGQLLADILPTPLVQGPAAIPASSNAAGTIGQIAYDSTYVYVCVDTNTWRRMPSETF